MKKGLLILGVMAGIMISAGLHAQTTGCIAGNCQDGYGAYQYDNGRYEGHFANGAKDGQGVYTWITGEKYDGSWVTNTMNGQGTIYFKDGSKFTGEVKNGAATDNGTYYLTDGTINKTKGFGKTPKTESKNGCTTGNCVSGYGVYYYLNSGRYEGNFVNGFRSGQGKYFWDNGEIYDGNWIDGLMEGQGTSTYSDGSKYIGEYKGGKITGNGNYYKPDGTIDYSKGKDKITTNNTKTTEPKKNYDYFGITLGDQMDDLYDDFSLDMGEPLDPDENADKSLKYYEYYDAFDSATDSKIAYNPATNEYSAVSEFYNGNSRDEALMIYAHLQEKIKNALGETYTYVDEQPTGRTLKSMTGGNKISDTVEKIPVANLRLDKKDNGYSVVIIVKYKEM
jgi:hypothetical protein